MLQGHFQQLVAGLVSALLSEDSQKRKSRGRLSGFLDIAAGDNRDWPDGSGSVHLLCRDTGRVRCCILTDTV